MNVLNRVISVLILVALTTAYVGCKKDDPEPVVEPTAQEIAKTKLTQNGGLWSPSSVTVGTTDVTTQYFSGFSITFKDDFTLTTTGSSPVWKPQDTWAFKGESDNILTRGQDDKEITIVSLTDTDLVLSLEWDQTTYEETSGRVRSTPGTYTFTLKK